MEAERPLNGASDLAAAEAGLDLLVDEAADRSTDEHLPMDRPRYGCVHVGSSAEVPDPELVGLPVESHCLHARRVDVLHLWCHGTRLPQQAGDATRLVWCTESSRFPS